MAFDQLAVRKGGRRLYLPKLQDACARRHTRESQSRELGTRGDAAGFEFCDFAEAPARHNSGSGAALVRMPGRWMAAVIEEAAVR